MNPIRQLASQTGLYGVSSILGRVLYYFLVGLHTKVFLPDDYGLMNYIFAQVAFLIIIYSYGMETAFFRFSSRFRDENYYHIAATSIFISSTVLSAALFLFHQQIAGYFGIIEQAYIFQLLAGILFIDTIVAIPFAKIRLENRPLKFVSVRLSSILLNILLNILFLYSLPKAISGEYGNVIRSWSNSLTLPDLGIGYVFMANLIANAFMLLFLYKEFRQFRFKFDWQKLKPLLKYAIPIMLMGLLGTIPEQVDKFFIKHWLSDDFYANKNALEALGVYSAAFKLSIFMMLAIQAFRFAGEPFFFSRSADKNAPKLFADVLYYFTLGCLLIFVGVSLNVEWIAQIFLRQASYREALYLVPILLFGKLFFGIYTHLTVWFKLTDKTTYGIWFSALGAAITVLGNLLLIPFIGYLGSAISSLLCYIAMAVICYQYGRKHFPVPYPIKKIAVQILVATSIVFAFYQLPFFSKWVNNSLGIAISLIYLLAIVVTEKNKLANTKY